MPAWAPTPGGSRSTCPPTPTSPWRSSCADGPTEREHPRRRGGADFTNPVIFADVPDPDVVFDGRYYYMVSTTMYFAPSVPIMRSSNLVHWSIAGYAAAILDDADALALRNGQDAYGQGSEHQVP
ncbi:family 43 glycosylhydrolase [Verrucosispora sp. FIM060022]|uniref:family 43 glycosylhydrolase n=1 Tax=Verrucosispora sp. FIM060022 TaxID=1479020 RepID=UPI000F86C31D|nr:family 43 glycosylhydrolase [Verrucosispora sp. FIM060022]RUL90345.1 hypothetical protein EG812_26175 [Verrucosispora sp. FIM060022]